jgi:signal transduction histidine kinase
VGVPRSSPDNSSFAGFIGCALDVTERKLAEKALASVSGRLIQAQEQERKRIARELHDDVNQRLALLQTDLNQLRENLPNSRADLRACMEELQERLSDASSEVIAISHRLHSSKLEYLGLVAACKGFCKEIAEHHKMPIEFNADNVPFTVPQDVSLTVFRVLQESLQNAIKYSSAKGIDVQLCGISGEIQLTVRDNGVGFDADEAMSNQGLGLISMRERISLVNGTILIKSKRMAGTEIQARVPLMDANEASKLRAVGA